MGTSSEIIDKAEYHLNLAKKMIDEGNPGGEIAHRIRAAFNRFREAWLLEKGVFGTVEGIDKYVRTDFFNKNAPAGLRRKCDVLDMRLSKLYYNKLQLEDRRQDIEDFPELWKEEALLCIDEIKALIEYIVHDNKLPLFRLEKEKHYFPGQWVTVDYYPCDFEVRNTVVKEGYPLTVIPYEHIEKVIYTDDIVVVLRDSSRNISKYGINSHLIRPSDREPDDMTVPFESRRTWFDLNSAFRHIPLYENPVCDEYTGFYTCPCCGYPMLVLYPHPSFDEYGYFNYEICILCDYADCYRDEDRPDKEDDSGDNFGNTLRQARQNFNRYLCMFSPKDGLYFRYQRTGKIMKLKKSLILIFDEITGSNNRGRIYLLWNMALKARKDLSEALIEEEHKHGSAFVNEESEEQCEIIRTFSDKWHEVLNPVEIGGYRNKRGHRLVWTGHIFKSNTGAVRDRKRNIYCSTEFRECNEPQDDGDDISSPFYVRRTWFEVNTDFNNGKGVCPCCGYPTLNVNKPLCFLCGWIDDGQDDWNAKEIHGLNGSLSLFDARKNFTETLSANGDFEIEDVTGIKFSIICCYHRLIEIQGDTEADDLWNDIMRHIAELKALETRL